MTRTTKNRSDSPTTGSNLSAGDALILGWRTETPPGLGLGKKAGAASRRAADEPILYDGDAHLLTVAPTGSGKGRGVIIPNLLTYPGPIVVFDPKGENYITTSRRRREMGHQVVKLDPFGVVDDKSDGLNPFDIFDLENVDLESDSQMLAELLATGESGLKEPFWDINGRALQSGLIAHVAQDREADDRHLNSVRKLLMGDDAVYQMAVVLDTVGKTMNEMAKEEIAAFLQMPDVTRGGVLATANSYIKSFLSEKVMSTLKQSTFSLQDVVDGAPLTIYLVIPPDKLRSHRGVVKLWVGALLKAITSRRYIPQQRTLFMLDECGQLQNFPLLETVMTLCRGFGVQCWTFWQDLAQLRTWYPQSWKTIMNNCGVVQTFGINNRDMATQWGNYLDHGPNQLKALRPEEQVAMIHGREELKLRRFDYLHDEPFQGLYDQNRFFAKPPPKSKPAKAAKKAPKKKEAATEEPAQTGCQLA